MKNIVLILLLITFSSVLIAQNQNLKKDEVYLKVHLDKTNLYLLEPMVAEFELSLPSSEISKNLLENISVKVMSNGDTNDFTGLDTNIIIKDPVALPPTNSGLILKQLETENKQKVFIKKKNKVIEKTHKFFPQPGIYQIQFSLHLSTRVLDSKVLTITVNDPIGINKDAYQLIKKYEDPSSFNWIWNIQNGVAVLENFVDEYADTVYADFARNKLADIYFARGEFSKAEKEYAKLEKSNNTFMVKRAKKSLASIRAKKGVDK